MAKREQGIVKDFKSKYIKIQPWYFVVCSKMTKFIHDMKIFELPKLKRESINGTRYYFSEDGGKYPSVTSVINPFSFPVEKRKAWIQNNFGGDERKAQEYTNKAGFRGTKVHSICEAYLKNKADYAENHDQKHMDLFNKIQAVLDKSINNIKSQEERLYSKKMGVAGTVDCIANFDGKLSVIDFKTKSRPTTKKFTEWHFVQCAAYANMWEEWTNIPIEQFVILVIPEAGESQALIENSIETKDQRLSMLQTAINSFYNN